MVENSNQSRSLFGKDHWDQHPGNASHPHSSTAGTWQIESEGVGWSKLGGIKAQRGVIVKGDQASNSSAPKPSPVPEAFLQQDESNVVGLGDAALLVVFESFYAAVAATVARPRRLEDVSEPEMENRQSLDHLIET